MSAPRAALLLLLALGLPACGAEIGGMPAAGVLAAAEAGTIIVADRGMVDVVVSLVSGRDCSIVRLARQETYCAPVEPPPERPPICTRGLGGVDCWVYPPAAVPPYRGLADGRYTLTPAQEASRTARWPGS